MTKDDRDAIKLKIEEAFDYETNDPSGNNEALLGYIEFASLLINDLGVGLEKEVY